MRRDEAKLEELKQKKLRLLDEVMEKETYKVAKEILDKFGGTGTTSQSVKPILTSQPGRSQPPATDTQLRRLADDRVGWFWFLTSCLHQ